MAHAMAKGKVFIVNKREEISRGIWKNSEQREKNRLNRPADWTWLGLSVREGRITREHSENGSSGGGVALVDYFGEESLGR